MTPEGKLVQRLYMTAAAVERLYMTAAAVERLYMTAAVHGCWCLSMTAAVWDCCDIPYPDETGGQACGTPF